MRAEADGGEPEQRGERSEPDRPRQVLALLGFLTVAAALVALKTTLVPVGGDGDRPEQNQHQRALPGDKDAKRNEHSEQRRGSDQRRAVPHRRLPRHHDRRDRDGEAEDEEQVGDVAADHVAEGDAGRAPERGLQGDHQLGHRGAEGHDRGPDEQRRDAQPPGQRDRAPHQRLTAHEEQNEPADELDMGQRVEHLPLWFAAAASCAVASSRSLRPPKAPAVGSVSA